MLQLSTHKETRLLRFPIADGKVPTTAVSVTDLSTQHSHQYYTSITHPPFQNSYFQTK